MALEASALEPVRRLECWTMGPISITGVNALRFPMSDSSNGSIAIGPGALMHEDTLASTPFSNVAIGLQTMSSGSMTTGAVDNVAVGYKAMSLNQSGAYNTAVGYMAAESVSSGLNNTALGYDALFTTTTGMSNVAIGSEAARQQHRRQQQRRRRIFRLGRTNRLRRGQHRDWNKSGSRRDERPGQYFHRILSYQRNRRDLGE